MNNDSGTPLTTLKVDGGMTANALLMQFLSDVLAVPVVRPTVAETTCLGAAYAAGLAVGFWNGTDALRDNWKRDAVWTPDRDAAETEREFAQWRKAVDRTLGWVEPTA
jgi:glycerol kinase